MRIETNKGVIASRKCHPSIRGGISFFGAVVLDTVDKLLCNVQKFEICPKNSRKKPKNLVEKSNEIIM